MVEELRKMADQIRELERRNNTELGHLTRRVVAVEKKFDQRFESLDEKTDRVMDSLIGISDILTTWNNTKGFIATIKYIAKLSAVAFWIMAFLAAVYLYGRTGQWKWPI